MSISALSFCLCFIPAALALGEDGGGGQAGNPDGEHGGHRGHHHRHHTDPGITGVPVSPEERQAGAESYWRGETEADRIYREATRARFDLDAEKARSLFEKAMKTDGSMRAHVKSRISLKCYVPKYPVSPECQKEFKAADELVEQGKLNEGLAAFQDLAVKYPKFEWAQFGLANIHLKKDDPERAATAARRALAINPDYVDAWMILAHDCLMHHDMDGARLAAQTAHELDPYSDVVSRTINLIEAELSKRKPD